MMTTIFSSALNEQALSHYDRAVAFIQARTLTNTNKPGNLSVNTNERTIGATRRDEETKDYCKWRKRSNPSEGDLYIDCAGASHRLIDRHCRVCGKHVWIFGGPANERNSLSNQDEVKDV
jgi:hypothetical protein